MKKKFFQKCFLSIGIFLLLTVLLPLQTVKAGTDDYRLNTKLISLVKGKAFALKVLNTTDNVKVTYKTDDQEIASVTEDGIIIANKVGATVITATIKDGVTNPTLTCDVLVGPPAFSVKITKSRVIIGLNQTDYLNVILKPSNTFETAKFFSNDPSIVSVSPGGRITANKLGLTNVFALIDATDMFGNRKYDSCSVIVTSTEDAPLLVAYFNDHPELDLISASELTSALTVFFNEKYDGTSLVNSLNGFLDAKFNLAELRKTREDNLAKIQSNALGVVSGTTN